MDSAGSAGGTRPGTPFQYRAGVQDRELRSVVLETLPLLTPPDGDEVICRIGLDARYGETPKYYVPSLLAFGKDEEWRDFDSLASRVMQGGELPAPRCRRVGRTAGLKQPVAPPRSVVEVMARLLVVAEVPEDPRVNVDEVGPVGVVHAGIQDHETWAIAV